MTSFSLTWVGSSKNKLWWLSPCVTRRAKSHVILHHTSPRWFILVCWWNSAEPSEPNLSQTNYLQTRSLSLHSTKREINGGLSHSDRFRSRIASRCSRTCNPGMYLSTDQMQIIHIPCRSQGKKAFSLVLPADWHQASVLRFWNKEHPLISFRYCAFKKPLLADAFSVSREMRPFSAAFVSISPTKSTQPLLHDLHS